MGCLKIQNFPAKKLRKIRAPKIRMRQFFLFHNSVSNICSVVVNFPAKRLRKNTVLKNTHAPFFFFLKFCEVEFYFTNACCNHVIANKSYSLFCLTSCLLYIWFIIDSPKYSVFFVIFIVSDKVI